MKILIVVPRTLLSDDINYAYMFPLGLAYLSSVLKQAGHSVEGFNLNHYAGSVESLLRDKIDAENKYDFVCIGGISTIYQQINMIVDAVHNIPFKQKLIMGGGIISSEPEMMFALFKPDYLVIGEGETTICELCSKVEILNRSPGLATVIQRENLSLIGPESLSLRLIYCLILISKVSSLKSISIICILATIFFRIYSIFPGLIRLFVAVLVHIYVHFVFIR